MNRMMLTELQGTSTPRNVYGNPSPGTSTDRPPTGEEMRARHLSGSVQRQPSLISGVRGLLMRPRSESLGEKFFRKTEAMRRVQVAECNVDQVYDLREMKRNLYDDEDIRDMDECFKAAFRRPRSNSSDFLILRKTSRPLSVHVVGLVDAQCDPYRQYMKVVECYELCPNRSRVVAVDSKISVLKAFGVMQENNLSALLVWNSDDQELTSIITLTDLLLCLRADPSKHSGELLVEHILSGNRLVAAFTSTKILDACEELLANKLHRLVVRDELGNAVFLLSCRRVLAAIHKQNRSLHFAQWLNRPIGKSTIGTWDDIRTVSATAKIIEAVNEMLGMRFSALPVVDQDNKVVGVITKKDIAAQIPDSAAENPREWMQTTAVEDIRQHCNSHVFVSGKDSTGSVLDRLLSGTARCAFVIFDDKAIGAISMSDLLGYLLRTDEVDTSPASVGPSTSSSTENVEPSTSAVGPGQ